ncbi:hypothetical protein PIB30_005281 [Stylosanthes scabra]|uniref:BZIP domain-containing protein n=1 Tax=Stylosanthes scabra TaxID=79078 RepID=A0ABU6U3R1_9FABA|nr:hypothetical protein [Stylosanthes scabra]
MQALRDEITGLNSYFLPSETYNYTTTTIPTMIQNTNNTLTSFQPYNNNSQFYNGNFLNQMLLLSNNSPSQSSCISSSNNSTSDEADEQQQQQQQSLIINERKHRRMISNRESARRSRMRKQKHLDELWSQVVWLRNENHQLLDKLNNVSESHDKILQENAQLREEASELRQMLCDMQLHSPICPPPLSPFHHHHDHQDQEVIEEDLNKYDDSSNQSNQAVV